MLHIELIDTIHRERQQEIERKLEVRRLLSDDTAPVRVTVREDPVPDRSSACVSGVRSAAGGR
jgi:hypothetical protein